MRSLETVKVVALFLELFALQICHRVNVVDIVVAVPVGAEVECAGKPPLQLLHIRFGHAGKAAGDSPLSGILQHCFHSGTLVPGTDGVGVHTAAIKMREEYGAAMDKSHLLPSPEEEIRKGVFTAATGNRH